MCSPLHCRICIWEFYDRFLLSKLTFFILVHVPIADCISFLVRFLWPSNIFKCLNFHCKWIKIFFHCLLFMHTVMAQKNKMFFSEDNGSFSLHIQTRCHVPPYVVAHCVAMASAGIAHITLSEYSCFRTSIVSFQLFTQKHCSVDYMVTLNLTRHLCLSEGPTGIWIFRTIYWLSREVM